MCDSKELLVSFLYEELDGAARQSFETHLTSCVECRNELAGLRATRVHLSAWSPPAPDFEFRIVRTPVTAVDPVPAPRFRFVPAWGLAAAAVLVLAAGAALAHIEVRYGSDGVVFRTGWDRAGAVPVVAETATAPEAGVMPVEWRQQADALERRLLQVETSMLRPDGAPIQAAGARVSDAEVLSRVRAMLGESESRQQRELVMRIRQVLQDVSAQRRTDMATIQQGFGQIQGVTGMEAAQHRDIMNMLKLVSQKQ
jgi:hypothetical protein